MKICTRLEDTASDIFSHHGWPHNLRIEPGPPLGVLQFLIMICNLSFTFLFYFLQLKI
jgi:hypothetical protein